MSFELKFVDYPTITAEFAAAYTGATGAGDALLVQNRLSELSTTTADQEAAQANIGLGAIDPLAYYILAKS